jgi:hypothetical protein
MYKIQDVPLNSTLTTTVFVSFGDTSMTRKTSLFCLYLLGRSYRTALQQMLKMYTNLLEDKHSPILVSFLRICEVLLGQFWQQSVQYCVPVQHAQNGETNGNI